MTLTPPDEFFNHQAAFPHATVGSSDPNWRERYWISIQDTVNRDVILTCGLGKYPNHDLLEGFVSVACDGKQRNLRLSRQLSPDSHVMRVGPLAVEVIEPLKTLRVTLDENESGMAFDVTWHAPMPPMLEGRHFQVSRTRVTHDLVRYVQLARISGEIAIPGHRFTPTAETWVGERDHSWGLRPMRRVPGAPPDVPPEWKLLMFCPIQFASFGVHVYLFEAEPGRPVHLSAEMCHPFGHAADDDMIVGVEHEFDWVEGAPVQTLAGGRLSLRMLSGSTLDIDLIAQAPRVYLRGGGYGIDQGQWKGESFLEHDVWDLTDPDTLPTYAAASSDHFLEARCNGEIGFGIMEYIVRRGYGKYPEAQRRK